MNDDFIPTIKMAIIGGVVFTMTLCVFNAYNKTVAAYFKSKENQTITLVIRAEGFKAEDVLTKKK